MTEAPTAGAPPPPEPAPPPPDVALAPLFAIPVLGAIFGLNSFHLGAWIVCLFSKAPCQEESKAEGGMVMLLLGFLAMTTAGAWAASRKKAGADALVAAAAAAVVAGIFSALTSRAEIAGLSDPSTWKQVYFVLVAAAAFVLPGVVRPVARSRWSGLSQLCGRMALAALISGVLGLVLQALPQIFGDAWVPGRGVRFYEPAHPFFFIVRPMGVGTIISAWAVLTYDPTLGPETWNDVGRRRRTGWMLGFWMLAVLLAIGYALTFYWLDGSNGKLVDAGVSAWEIALIFAALLLSPLAGFGWAVRLQGRGGPAVRLAVALCIAGAGSVAVAPVLLLQIRAAPVPVAMFAAIHLLGALATVLVTLAVVKGWFRRAARSAQAESELGGAS